MVVVVVDEVVDEVVEVEKIKIKKHTCGGSRSYWCS